nr:hypothetical protein BHI3_07570 [Bacteriovorax sp. HI3]
MGGAKEKAERGFAAVATGGMSEVARAAAKELKPNLPAAPDYEAQKAAAEAEVEAKQLKDINLKNSGVSSTMMGGSTGDDSNLKKKKLLGE